MRFTHFIFLATSLLLPMKSYSQDISLTLEDLIPGGKTYYKYRAEMPRQLVWYGENLIYAKGDSLMIAPYTDKEKPKVLLTLADINNSIQIDQSQKPGSLNRVQFVSPQSQLLRIVSGGSIYLYDMVTKTVKAEYKSLEKAENRDWAEGTDYMAYTKDNNLYIQDGKSKEIAVTNESNKGVVSGQTVHRNEFGIDKGTFWSPQGDLLAFYRMDETMVTDYPLVDISARVARLKDIKYPMAGMKSHHVTIGIYNPVTNNTVFLNTGTPKEKYLTNVTWSPDGKSVYVAELNRGQDTCVLKSYNAASGKLEVTLFTETHKKYVEPEHGAIFLKSDPSKFLWFSKRDGFNHLYLYDVSGKLIRQITSGSWDVLSALGFDEKGENLFYLSAEASPIEKHIYKLDLKTGKKIQLSKEEGMHSAMLSASGRYISDVYNSQYNAGKAAITDTKTNKTHIFHSAKDPFRNTKLPEITLGSIKTDDGKTNLYYRLVKPLNFDPNKKYPVVVYVYGGPHSQMVTNSWMAQTRGWEIYMAEKGYIAFSLDNRGTSNRGFDFENITHRQLGVVETKDQMSGVAYLKSLPYVDADRIGVHGWSFGGFMTMNLMLRHSDVFKVGVAGGPVTDWKYYEIMYGERYMDSPQENPEGYKETSMVNRASDLKGRLLIIHGDEDPTVVMQHSLQFIKSAIGKGSHPDFFVYPGHGHNMIGRDRVHLHEHITRYFDDFLK